MKQLNEGMKNLPYGFPIGWIAARICEGRFDLAVWDVLGCVVLISAMIVISRTMNSAQ